MDNLRTVLWALFAALLFLTWSKWQTDNAALTAASPQSVELAQDSVVDMTPPALPPTGAAAVPELPGTAGPAPAQPAAAEERYVTVVTDVLDLRISTTGGTLAQADLRKYPKDKKQPDVSVRLLSADPAAPYLLYSGLVDSERGGPTHLAQLTAAAERYELQPGEDQLEVPLRWQSNGVSVEKIYRLTRGRYDIEVEYRVNNRSQKEWRGISYMQIRKLFSPPERSMFDVDSYSFDGPVIYDGNKYTKLDPDDFPDEPVNQSLAGGWIASIQHHFLSAAVPAPDEVFSYDASFDRGVVTLRANGPATVVPPGAQASLSADFFVGPKLQDQLEETAAGLPLTVDYGILAILAQPLFWLLQQVHDLLGNWGWAIIAVTFLIKLVFYKLTETSGRSMAKMRKLQPRLKALQERYKDDRQALSQHMMDLYKREKVNPAAGCLPMFVQIPFFIAFYWVLLESVEMRQAPFALWITDLSSRDPYFVLPLFMGVAMFVQQKLNPAPPDPVQAKVMSILPIIFTVFFAFFPAGLVLYWLTNSVLSVIQQWNINRKLAVD
jgi:YidC/Oxa1 family membrane protein insertase